MVDTVVNVLALALMSWGVVQSLIAGIGLVRFPDVLTRMHAASKPQMLGVVLVLAGAAIFSRSWAVAGFMVVAVLAEFLTVPASSSLVGRSAFRRQFVDPDNLVHDELSANLPRGLADADDTEGFLGDGAAVQGEMQPAHLARAEAVSSAERGPAPDNRFPLDQDEFVNFALEDEAGEPAQAEYEPTDRAGAFGKTTLDLPVQSRHPETGPGSDDRLG